MNPIAIAFYICGTAIGFAIDGNQGAAIGLAVTTGISVILGLLA